MQLKCKKCDKKILRHSHYFTCTLCSNNYHFLCLHHENRPIGNYMNWSCQDCNINIFPFNSVENEIEFRCIISNNNIDSDFLQNNDYLLNYFPSELNELNNDVLTEAYDPEIHYYNEFTSSQVKSSQVK